MATVPHLPVRFPAGASRRDRYRLGFLVLGTFAIIACGGPAAEWEGTVELRDGVPHLLNPAEPLWGSGYQPLVQREVLGAPGGPTEAFMSEPVAVACSADGIRYVLDARDRRILRFAPDGACLGSFGRSGEGPGEFQNPQSLTFLPDGSLLVADFGSFRLSWFTPGGEFIDSVTLQFAPGQVVATGSGELYVHGQIRGPIVAFRVGVQGAESGLFDRLDARGEKIGSFGLVEEYEGVMLGQWMNKVLPALAPGDSLIANHFGKDRIEVYTPDGTLARVVHRNLPFQPVEPVEDTEQTENSDGSISMSMRLEFDILSTGFAVRPDGGMWAALVALTQTDRRPGVESEDEIPRQWGIDLFDAAGRWLARHRFGTDFAMAYLDWGSDGLYLINAQEDAAVYRFEIMPPQ